MKKKIKKMTPKTIKIKIRNIWSMFRDIFILYFYKKNLYFLIQLPNKGETCIKQYKFFL